jgi:pyruvate,water dikinase
VTEDRIAASEDAPPGRERVGGKAWNLLRLVEKGLPVPRFLVVTTRVFEEVTARIQPAIEAALANLDPRRQADAEHAAEKIRAAFLGAGLAAGDRERLVALHAALWKPETLVAVRSSGVAEDASDRSFAGQMDTFLDVRPEKLEASVLACFASAWSPRALLYRALHGARDLGVAVLVQEMIASRASGVLFTADPATGDRMKAVISAGLGLGEGVVADKVETDTFTVELATGLVLDRKIARKRGRVVLDRARSEGTLVEAIDDSAACLTDVEIATLTALARKIAESEPQDVEWATTDEGEIFILQARPITALPEEELRVFDCSNVVESYPGLTLPLTFTFARAAYERTFRQSSRTFGVPESVLAANSHVHANLIALIEGRVYYNLLNLYRLFQLVPGFEGVLPAWEKALGLPPGAAPRTPPPTFLQRFQKYRILVRAISLFRSVDDDVGAFLDDFKAVHEEFRARDLARLSEPELLRVYRDLAERLLGPYSVSVVNDVFAQQLHEVVAKLIARWGLEASRNDLFCGERGMESVEPLRSVLAIAARIRADEKLRNALARDDAWSALHQDPTLAAALAEHVKRFGDRTLEELKLETPPLDLDPRFLVATLRNLVAGGQAIDSMEVRERAIREAAEAQVRSRLRWHPLRRLVFDYVLSKARRTVRFRENLRLARARAFGMVKRIFLEVGSRLAGRGMIEEARDVFWLTTGELEATSSLRALVKLRKDDYGRFAKKTLPTRIVSGGSAAPVVVPTTPVMGTGELRGVGCSPGVARARARIVRSPDPDLRVQGEILVAPMTDPGWVFLMAAASAIVVERGSILSHTAIIGRELGIPTVVGVPQATSLIRDGEEIEVDGFAGTVAHASLPPPA